MWPCSRHAFLRETPRSYTVGQGWKAGGAACAATAPVRTTSNSPSSKRRCSRSSPSQAWGRDNAHSRHCSSLSAGQTQIPTRTRLRPHPGLQAEPPGTPSPQPLNLVKPPAHPFQTGCRARPTRPQARDVTSPHSGARRSAVSKSATATVARLVERNRRYMPCRAALRAPHGNLTSMRVAPELVLNRMIRSPARLITLA